MIICHTFNRKTKSGGIVGEAQVGREESEEGKAGKINTVSLTMALERISQISFSKDSLFAHFTNILDPKHIYFSAEMFEILRASSKQSLWPVG